MLRRPRNSPLFPYTTLFRSAWSCRRRWARARPRACPPAPRGRRRAARRGAGGHRSEEHTSELQSHVNLVCRLLLGKKKKKINYDVTQQRTNVTEYVCTDD